MNDQMMEKVLSQMNALRDDMEVVEYQYYKNELFIRSLQDLLHPDDPYLLAEKGRIHFLLGQYDLSKMALSKSLKLQWNNPSAHYNYSVVLHACFDWELSEMHRKVAISMDPTIDERLDDL